MYYVQSITMNIVYSFSCFCGTNFMKVYYISKKCIICFFYSEGIISFFSCQVSKLFSNMEFHSLSFVFKEECCSCHRIDYLPGKKEIDMFPVFGIPCLSWCLKALWLESTAIYTERVTLIVRQKTG